MREGQDTLDSGAIPMTEPHPAPIFDTGPHPDPLVSYDSDPFAPVDHTPPVDSMPRFVGGAHISGPLPVPAQPVVVPGQLQFVKRWKFTLVLAGVWIAAAAAGAGLYHWWFHSMDKTWPEAGVLLFVIACTLAALLASLTESKPMSSSLALALMSAPFAAACGSAALYGAYAFGWIVP